MRDIKPEVLIGAFFSGMMIGVLLSIVLIQVLEVRPIDTARLHCESQGYELDSIDKNNRIWCVSVTKEIVK